METPAPFAVVTGANRGLGLETARLLSDQGWRVLLGCRREREGRRAAAALVAAGRDVASRPLDLADPASVDRFVERTRADGRSIDALVQNAGVYKLRLDEASARETMAVNVLGPLRLGDGLLPLLAPGARVVLVSSGMGQLAGLSADLRREVEAVRTREDLVRLAEHLADLGRRRAGGANPYSVSKAALNAAARLLAAELAPRHVLVNAVCPGWVRTDMGGPGAPRSLEEGAAGIVWAATLPPGGPSGGFFRDGRPLPW